ncbi:MAG TPA: hypothetical protein ENN44_07215 [Methanoculleus sp.]|nr:hypothetical protein [Methanoculleus sp.]
MTRRIITLALVILTIVVLTCAGCTEIEAKGAEGSAGQGGSGATATPTPQWVQQATPIKTSSVPTGNPTAATPTAVPKPAYTEIYHDTHYLLYDTVSLQFDLTTPPMVIKYIIRPDMITYKQQVYSSYGDKDKITVTKSHANQNAELLVEVYDLDTMEIIESEEYLTFPVNDDGEMEESITLYYPGNYHVELSGGFVEVEIVISVPESNLNTT